MARAIRVAQGHYCLIEYMPEYLRASHQAARNWGRYPLNGARRVLCDSDTAEDLVAEYPDYNRVLRDSRAGDLEDYDFAD